MNSLELKIFLDIEKKYLSDARWYQGLKICKDPGDEFEIEWVLTSAEAFRQKYDNSCCRKCCHIRDCGVNLIEECQGYYSFND